MDETRSRDFRNLFSKYVNKIGVTIVTILLLCFVFYQISLASTDNFAFTSHFTYNMFAIVVPVLAILCIILLTAFPKSFGLYVIGGILIAIAAGGLLFYLLQTNLSKYIFNQYLLNTVIALIIIVGLTIVATVFSQFLRNQTGWTGFLANLLFYIPCLIRDGIHSIIGEYQTLSGTVLVLFVIEVVLLIMYFCLIPLFNTVTDSTNIKLLDDPVMLNTATPLSVAPIYTSETDTNNFAISMWVYVNPAPNTKLDYTHQTPIFTYSCGSSDYYFTLNYSNDIASQTQFNLDISNSDARMNPIPVSMPLQKWNNVVFNVITPTKKTDTKDKKEPNKKEDTKGTTEPAGTTGTTVDVFINGVLTQSVPLHSTPVFSSADRITVGNGSVDANTNGLYGAICNVSYYRQPLSRLSIIYNYNTHVIKNPPV